MKIGNVYWDVQSMKDDVVQPSILAIGDSWFWYPFGGSLIVPIGRLLHADHRIYSLGNNGAESGDYLSGQYSNTVRGAIAHYGSGLSAVLISGGGNDFAGFSDFRPLLNDDCSAAPAAAACFRPGADERTIDWLIGSMTDNYRALIELVMQNSWNGTKIFLHNYDYALPSGRGVFGTHGGWLRPALLHAGVPSGLQRECVKHLIDRLTGALRDLVRIDPSRIVLVESAGTLGEHDWADELHPTPHGFRRIAGACWYPVLKAHALT